MDIQETRRLNLARWLTGRTAPLKDKSFMSQLKSGSIPFGERAARRLERDHGMGAGYLDHVEDEGQLKGTNAPGDSESKDWPFQSVSKYKYQSLPEEDRRMIESIIQMFIDRRTKKDDADDYLTELSVRVLKAMEQEREGSHARRRGAK